MLTERNVALSFRNVAFETDTAFIGFFLGASRRAFEPYPLTAAWGFT